MAYDPMIYNPYLNPSMWASNSQKQVNGLISVESYEGAQLYSLPPSSVSPPLFLSSDNVFFVKTTDSDGVPSIKAYKFEECEIPQSPVDNEDYVTKADLVAFEDRILEAINGQHSTPEPEPKPTSRSRKSAAKSSGKPKEDGAEQSGLQPVV